MGYKDKETEFNMSLSTLQRIDKLIKQANLCSQGLFSLFCNAQLDDNAFYIKALEGIFLESQTKMTDDEITKCGNFRNGIMGLKHKWIRDINMPTKTETGITKVNINYIRAWREIKNLARQYNIYLMRVMDGHNMLLKNKDLTSEGIY